MKRASGADTPKAHAVTNPVSLVNIASSAQWHPSTLCDIGSPAECKQSLAARRPQCFPSSLDDQRHFWFFCSLWIVGALLCPISAQAPRVALQGKVLDPTHAPIAGARITATLQSRPDSSATSDAQGEFSLLLEPGAYSIKIVADGFVERLLSIDLTANGSSSREIVLEIAPHLDAVTVSDSGYQLAATSSGTKTLTPMRDIPQSITVVTQELIRDQMMTSIGDVVRYVPGITAHQGENNRDQVIIRGNSSSADFFVNGVRDDVQYYRDLYNLERVEALKGPNAMIFGRGGMGGVINRVSKEAGFTPLREISLMGGSFGSKTVCYRL